MAELDVSVKDGIVVDGTRSQRYRGGCGWSAQRLHPDGPGAVQRDYDGGPMVTDVMHDETALQLVEVLSQRNQGFMQMALATANVAHDFLHIEALADVSGRPLLYNVVQSFVGIPEAHRTLLAWLDSCRQRGLRVYGQGVTTTAAFTFTCEDWNLFHDSAAWAVSHIVREEENVLARARALAAVGASPPVRRGPRSRVAGRGSACQRGGVRSPPAGVSAHAGGARPAWRGVAARPARAWLPLRARERRGHPRGGSRDRCRCGQAPPQRCGGRWSRAAAGGGRA